MEYIECEKCSNETSGSEREEMAIEMNSLCEMLISSMEEFDVKKTTKFILDYANNHDRLLYSVLSNYIFDIHKKEDKESREESLSHNIDTLFNFVCENKFEAFVNDWCQNNKLDKEISEIKQIAKITRKMVYKIYDHVNLAQNQINKLKLTDSEYADKFGKQIQPIKEKISEKQEQLDKSVNEAQKEMRDFRKEIVSLLGIFTAIAFLVFGSISEFNNIFSHVGKISVLKLLILGSIWGICLINLLYVFLFCIGKMTRLNFANEEKQDNASNVSTFQKYPIVWWSNYIVISIFVLSSILYFATYRLDVPKDIEIFVNNNAGNIAIFLILLIVAIIVIFTVFKFLCVHCNPENDFTIKMNKIPFRNLFSHVLVSIISFIAGVVCVLLIIWLT